MKNIGWDAYQIFLAVARHGGLTGASVQTGLSPATIGRRILQLEEMAGLALFSRSQAGYALTVDGQALYEQVLGMEAASRKLESWREGTGGTVTVRVMAGTWGGRLIAENITAIVNPRENIRIDLRTGERRAQLAHRENDIGIRAVAPDEPNLAGRLLSDVAYAAYRLKNAPDYLGERCRDFRRRSSIALSALAA
jgi:DNA-binding transcriptional LysR family regulator